jgi:hypothetical protein
MIVVAASAMLTLVGSAALEGAAVGVVIELVGIETARTCWEKARGAETDHERAAWGRLARKFFRKVEVTRSPARESQASACEVGQLAMGSG